MVKQKKQQKKKKKNSALLAQVRDSFTVCIGLLVLKSPVYYLFPVRNCRNTYMRILIFELKFGQENTVDTGKERRLRERLYVRRLRYDNNRFKKKT